MDENQELCMKYFLNDGFLKPQIAVEHPLYRYRSNLDYALDEIVNDHIYLAPIEALNDPFDSSYATSLEEALARTNTLECYFSQCYFLHHEKWYSTLKNNLSPCFKQEVSLEKFSEILSEEIKKEGYSIPASAIAKSYYRFVAPHTPKRISYGHVACFSEAWDSIPMWSYYADSHKGLCMKYDFSLLHKDDQSTQNILSSLQKVWYSQNRPFDAAESFSPFIKGLQWAHEQEWRLFRKFGSEFVVLPCLTEIYLGVNFEFSKIDLIMDAAKNHSRNIGMFMLRPNPNTYGFQKVPIDYK